MSKIRWRVVCARSLSCADIMPDWVLLVFKCTNGTERGLWYCEVKHRKGGCWYETFLDGRRVMHKTQSEAKGAAERLACGVLGATT